jgi:NADH dehydrogenase
MAEVLNVQVDKKTITTSIGNFEYDYLIIAIGCKTNFFGNESIAKNAFTLKTTYDAILVQNHILKTFEKILSANEQDKVALLNLAIVGAGPTGVELSGAFAEIKKYILPKDYPGIDFSTFKIILLEGSKNTLNNMSESAKAASRKYLEALGVEIHTETVVKNYDGDILELTNGQTIQTKTVIWAAGVTGNTLEGIPEAAHTFGNRLKRFGVEIAKAFKLPCLICCKFGGKVSKFIVI